MQKTRFNYSFKIVASCLLFLCPFIAHAENGNVVVKKGVLNQVDIKASRLLSELAKIDKIIQKQNKVYDDMRSKEKKLTVPLKKISQEEDMLEGEIKEQKLKLSRRMRTIFPYKRSRIINYILGESQNGSFFQDVQLLKIVSRKDAKLIREYKSKLGLLKKKNKNTGLRGKV